LRTLLILTLTGCALAGGLSYWLESRHVESTDDAFIAGHVTSVSARVQGRVKEVLVVDNQQVTEGEVLLRIDPADYLVRRD
jgi:membrane fusion protein (multidrug efflux system)